MMSLWNVSFASKVNEVEVFRKTRCFDDWRAQAILCLPSPSIRQSNMQRLLIGREGESGCTGTGTCALRRSRCAFAILVPAEAFSFLKPNFHR